MPPVPRRSRSPLRSPTIAILGALAIGTAIARGGVDLPAIAAVALLGPLALVLAVRRGRRRGDPVEAEGRVSVPILVPGLALAVLAVGLQLVPLPAFLVHALSPATADLFARHLGPIGAYPAFRPLSLDPGATALELAKVAAFTAILAAAAVAGLSRERRDALLRAVAIAGPAVVAVMFGAILFGREPLVEPRVPFVNPNHLAGFLQLAAWTALGFAVRDRGAKRVGWLLAFAFSAAGVFLSLSRGGIAAFFVGAGIFATLFVRAGRRRVSDPKLAPRPWREVVRAGLRPTLRALAARSSTVVPVAVSAALTLAAYLALDRIVGEMRTIAEASTTEVKLGLWPVAARMIAAHPLTGIGRGAFATAFPAYKWEPLAVTFTHVENEFLQLPVEMGVLFGGGTIALFAWAYFSAARRDEISRPMIGALAGVGALVAHNVFDFSLEMPGVAIPFAVTLGVLARDLPSVRVRAWAVRASAAGALALAAAGLAVHMSHPPDEDAQRVAAATSGDEALARAREVIPWHPADWVPPAVVGGLLAAEFRCAEAEPWLLRAMERNPTAAAPHRGAARCFSVTRRPALAKREYRLAWILGDGEALAEAHNLFPGPGELLEIAPDTPDGLAAAAHVLRDRPEEAREAWQRAWNAFAEPRALAGLAAATLELHDLDPALAFAQRLEHVAPQDRTGYLLAARALDAKKDADGAIRELDLGAARLPGDVPVLIQLGLHHLEQRRFAQARATFEKMLAREPHEVAMKKLLVARALEGQGRYGEALGLVREARQIEPDSAEPLVALARISQAAGRYDEAVEALETAAHKPGVAPGAYDAWLSSLREARIRATVKLLGDEGAGAR